MRRGEEAEPVGGADGLLQVTHFVHEFLNGVVAFHRALLDHLWMRGEAVVTTAAANHDFSYLLTYRLF